jgi:uncharacterized protein (DUF2147 family)
VFKRISLLITSALVAAALMVPVSPALAAQNLPENCEKATGNNPVEGADPGTVVCTTEDKPGNSDDNGQGKQPITEVKDETQGNAKNKSPEESQDLANNECDPNASPGLCKQAQREAAQ